MQRGQVRKGSFLRANLLLWGAVLGAGCSRHAPSEPSVPAARAPEARAASGLIEGRVVLQGPAPASRPLATNASVEAVCGAAVPDGAFEVSKKGGLAHAVVWVDAPPVPGPDKVLPSAEVDQRGCVYRPAVIAARAGSHLTLVNSDPLVHMVRAVEGGRSAFSFAMPLSGMRVMRVLPASPGVVALKCDVHPWMRAVVRTFNHPYFTLTDREGRFRLEEVPEGARTLHVWHDQLPERKVPVHVSREGTQLGDVPLSMP